MVSLQRTCMILSKLIQVLNVKKLNPISEYISNGTLYTLPISEQFLLTFSGSSLHLRN
jgi:hypothetical protein